MSTRNLYLHLLKNGLIERPNTAFQSITTFTKPITRQAFDLLIAFKRDISIGQVVREAITHSEKNRKEQV